MFQPGNQLGVGHGRPKGSSKPLILKKWIEEKGWEKLISIAEGRGHAFREYNGRVVEVGPNLGIQLEAMKLAFAYGIGKPTECEAPSKDPEESKLRVDQMMALLNKLEAPPLQPQPSKTNGNGNGTK